MSRQRFLALLCAALLVLGGAWYLSLQRHLQRDARGDAFLPYLDQDMSRVTGLLIRKASSAASVTLQQRSGRWTVAERADYPADVSKLRKLLLALHDSKIAEEKTSNPASYAHIGVEDPSSPSAAGAEITVIAPDGSHRVIIGKSTGEGNFARVVGDSKSYFVEPAISFETEPRSWIDAQLLDIAAAKIQSIEIKPATGAAYTVRRLGAGDNKFTLDAAPKGRKAADSTALGPSPTTFTNLAIEDVAPAIDIDFSQAMIAKLTLSDASVLILAGSTSGGKHWLKVMASGDAALTAKAAGRAFELSSYRYDAIFRTLEQLLVPKAPPAS